MTPIMGHASPRSALRAELEAVGRTLGAREAAHADALARARAVAESLHADVAFALEGFHAAAREAGAPWLAVALGPVRSDEKHLRAVEFDLVRGRHRALVTVKSKGVVTLVGPFQSGKEEGPCRRLPWDVDAEIRDALGALLARFLEQAATP